MISQAKRYLLSGFPYALLALLGLWITHQVDHAALHVLHGESIKIYEVAGIYVEGWISPLWEPFSGRQISASYVLKTLFYLVSVWACGVVVLTPLFKAANLALAAWLGSAFIIGYLVVVPINRIITLFCSYEIGPSLILAIIPLVAILAGVYCKTWTYLWSRRSEWLRASMTLSAVLFFFVIFQIQFGRNYMAADSVAFFLNSMQSLLANLDPKSTFPLVDVQYDELLFGYPLFFPDAGRRLYLIPFWIMNGLGKASTAFMIYSIIRLYSAQVPSYLAALVTTFIFLGTSSLNPFYYISLWGGQNPLIFNGHSGRMIGVFAPWFCVLMAKRVQADAESREGVKTVFSAVMLGLGLAATSINNFIVTVHFLFMWIIFSELIDEKKLLRSFEGKKRVALSLMAWIFGPVLTYIVFGWLIDNLAGRISAIFLLLALTLLIAAMVVAFRRDVKWPQVFGNSTWSLAFVGSALLGFTFLGNLPLRFLFSFLSRHPGIWSWFPSSYHIQPMSRGAADLGTRTYFLRYQGCETPSWHCKGPAMYIAYYGLFTIVVSALVGLIIFRGRRQSKDDSPSERESFYFLGLTFCLFWFAYGHFFTDFAQAGALPWIRSRLIEVPFYGVFILAAIMVTDYVGTIHRRIQSIGLAVWTFLPFIWNYGLQQWWMNLKYLMEKI